MKLILYGTAGCHLCEEAESRLQAVIGGREIAVAHVDIADDDQLLEQYGWKIPVLAKSGSDAVLCWPFDMVAIQAFIDTAQP